MDPGITPFLSRGIRSLAAAWLVAWSALITLLFSHYYIPMVDVPHFAGLLTVWRDLSDPGFADAGLYTIDWFQPYLLPMLAGYALTYFCSSITATKLIIALAGISYLLSLDALLRRVNTDRWLSLLGFVSFFGYGYQWGFVAYMVALPLAALSWCFALDMIRSPSLRNYVKLFYSITVLSLTHGIAAGLTLVGVFVLLCSQARTRKEIARLFCWTFPLVLPLGLLMMCFFQAQELGPKQHFLSLDFDRIPRVLSTLFGGEFDLSATGLGIFVTILLCAWSGCRRNQRWAFVVPLIVYMALAAFSPGSITGRSIIQRIMPFILMSVFMALDFDVRYRVRFVCRFLLVLLAAYQLQRGWKIAEIYNNDLRPLRAAVARIPKFSRTAAVVVDIVPKWPLLPLYDHAAGWIQAERGGTFASTFALSPPMVVRIKAKRGSPVWHRWRKLYPSQINFPQIVANYDYIFVRADRLEQRHSLQLQMSNSFKLMYQQDAWMIFKKNG